MQHIVRFVILVSIIMALPLQALPCSTAVILNCNEVVSARTMDFGIDMKTMLSIIPKGTKYKFGTTKLNFISIDAFGQAIGHGINEKGLSVANLWLNPTKYPEKAISSRKSVGVFEFSAFVLGTMSSVGEVLAFFDSGDIDFTDVPEEAEKLDLLHQHIYFVDSKGETLVLEWINGKRFAYLNETPVLVNDPPMDEQKIIWETQVLKKEDIVNWEYNLISKKMHDPDTRYQMLRRLTEQSLPSKGSANVDKAFQIMKRVSYFPIRPYISDHVSWTLYTVVTIHTKDAVKLYYTDDENESIRMVDLARIEWKKKSIPIQSGPKFFDMTQSINRSH